MERTLWYCATPLDTRRLWHGGAGQVVLGTGGEAIRPKNSRRVARTLRSGAGNRQRHGGFGGGPRIASTRAALGIGERVGNTQMDQMLVNLKLMGIAPWDTADLTSSSNIARLFQSRRAFRFRRTIR